MKIAVASGKGGTGKTTVAVSLAVSLEGPIQLLDCDVEEPNSHLFIPSTPDRVEPVTVPVPEIDATRCNACGQCARFCEYNALVSLATQPMVFAELCHGCGGCRLICPRAAITEGTREVGSLQFRTCGSLELISGMLNIGQAMAPPVIRAVKKHGRADGITIIDSPPGTSCPFIEAVRGSDYTLLVTEPTPFGFHDLKLAVETMRLLGIPFGVIINRADTGDSRTTEYCRKEGIPVLMEIPDRRDVAEAISRGETLVSVLPELKKKFVAIPQLIEEQIWSRS